MKGFGWSKVILQGVALLVASSAVAAPKESKAATATATATATAPMSGNAKAVGKSGDVGTVGVTGVSKEKLDVGKFDPPAAFNLEDIQNFPEDRLQPVLNNPVTFEEGRDFTTLMDFQDEQIYHPWLPEIPKAPFLRMKGDVEKVPAAWTFNIIDQNGATVAKTEGKGAPPSMLTWNGEDGVRDHIAVETVYIPQLATTDKEGYHHTFSGQPIQFSALTFKDHGRTVIEVSSKRLFQEKKSDWTKESVVLLGKLLDALREDGQKPFTIQPYDSDSDLGRERQKQLKDYFVAQLHIPPDQVGTPEPQGAEKRGNAMVIMPNSGGGQ